jgi:hypothetical protein
MSAGCLLQLRVPSGSLGAHRALCPESHFAFKRAVQGPQEFQGELLGLFIVIIVF